MGLFLKARSHKTPVCLAETSKSEPWKAGGSACESNTPSPVRSDRRFLKTGRITGFLGASISHGDCIYCSDAKNGESA